MYQTLFFFAIDDSFIREKNNYIIYQKYFILIFSKQWFYCALVEIFKSWNIGLLSIVKNVFPFSRTYFFFQLSRSVIRDKEIQ